MQDSIDPADSVGTEKDMKRLIRHLLDKVDALEVGTSSVVVGDYELLDRTTLEVAGNTITVEGFPYRRYLKVVSSLLPSGAITGNLRFNNDSATNYFTRSSTNGAASVDSGAIAQITMDVDTTATAKFTTYEIMNVATYPKLVRGLPMTGNTAFSAPNQRYVSSKWINIVDTINRVDVINTSGGAFDVGSEVLVFGLRVE